MVKCITDINAKLYFDIYYCVIKTYFSQIHGAFSTSVALDEVRDRDRWTYYYIINTMKFMQINKLKASVADQKLVGCEPNQRRI